MSGEEFHFLMFVLQLSRGGACLAGITELTLESSVSFPLPLNRKPVLQEEGGFFFFWSCLKEAASYSDGFS